MQRSLLKMEKEKICGKKENNVQNDFYPTALKGCWGIVFTHGVRMGRRVGGRREKSLSGLYLRNRKV